MAACGGGAQKPGAEAGQTAEKKFTHVTIPAMMTSPEQRVEYLAQHYWDNFDFADTTYINIPEVTEQAFADYANTLSVMPSDVARKSINSTLDKAAVDKAMLDYFVELSEKYLYESNSPLKHEENYILVLEYILASDKFDDIEKLRPESQLKLALKNRLGEKASDFTYTLASGRQGRMYDIRADYTLVYINNPDCSACAQITRDIQASPLLSHLVSTGKMKILALYPDQDLTAWLNHQKDMPSAWINSYDKELTLRDQDLYDLRAIPTLYLLDKDKTVLLKDAAAAMVLENYFMRNVPESELM